MRGLLRGYLSHFWVVLSDCRTRALKGYGAVAPELVQRLDPEIEALLERAEAVIARRQEGA